MGLFGGVFFGWAGWQAHGPTSQPLNPSEPASAGADVQQSEQAIYLGKLNNYIYY